MRALQLDFGPAIAIGVLGVLVTVVLRLLEGHAKARARTRTQRIVAADAGTQEPSHVR